MGWLMRLPTLLTASGSSRRLLTSSRLAESAAAPFGLRYVKPPLRLPALQTNMFWHRRYNQDEGNVWLRGFISAHFAE